MGYFALIVAVEFTTIGLGIPGQGNMGVTDFWVVTVT